MQTFFLILSAFFIFLTLPQQAEANCQDWEYNCTSCSCSGTGCTQTCTGYDFDTADICEINQSCNLSPQKIVDSCDCDDTRSDTDESTWTFRKVSCTNGSQCIGDIGYGGTGCHYCATVSCNENGKKDNGETGVDCGGGGCGSCPVIPGGCGESPCGMCERKMSDGTCKTENNICCHRKCFGDGCWTTSGEGGDECEPEGPGICKVPPAANCTVGMDCGSTTQCGGGWCKGCNPDGATPDPVRCPLGGKCETCAPDPPRRPPPPPGKPWIKLKNASVYDSGIFYSPIHLNPAAYDSEDNDLSRKLIIGQAGVVAARDIIRLDGHGPGALPSTPLWKMENFDADKVDISEVISYIKARKKHTNISRIDHTLENNTIYIWNGEDKNIEITQTDLAHFRGKNIVFVTEGVITFNVSSKKIDTNSSVAFIGNVINFFKDTTYVEEANGIFISSIAYTGPATGEVAQGLKIIGNISTNSLIMRRKQNADNRKPSLFIVFDPVQYLELFPMLSTSSYDWKQLQ